MGKLTIGEFKIHNQGNYRQIDCHSFSERDGRCPYGNTGGENCHHLTMVPKSFQGAAEIPGCAGTGGKPWKLTSSGEFAEYHAFTEKKQF
jgi:hypothetical protein